MLVLTTAAAEDLTARFGEGHFDAYQGDAGASPFYLKCGYRLVHKGTMRGVPLDYFDKVLTRGT